jgi:DNA-binding MarR family transcriptional regulator
MDTTTHDQINELSPRQYRFLADLPYWTHGISAQDADKRTVKALVRRGLVRIDDDDTADDIVRMTDAGRHVLRADPNTATLRLRKDAILSRAWQCREAIRYNARFLKHQSQDCHERIVNEAAAHLAALVEALAEGPDAKGTYDVRW